MIWAAPTGKLFYLHILGVKCSKQTGIWFFKDFQSYKEAMEGSVILCDRAHTYDD